jgi:hypothetical protein
MGQFSEFDYAVGDYCRHLEADHNKSFGNIPYMFIYEVGRKYVKIIMCRTSYPSEDRSSHSWIVIGDQGKFKHGDILKSATWKAPAKNFARGNVLTGNFKHIRWAGI